MDSPVSGVLPVSGMPVSTVLPGRSPLESVLTAISADLPDIIKEVETIDPALAPKALLASRTPWGTLAVTALGWLLAKYGLHWDSNVVDLVAGGSVLLGSFGMRYITSAPIKGLIKSV